MCIHDLCLSKNKKNIIFVLMNTSIFTTVKNVIYYIEMIL